MDEISLIYKLTNHLKKPDNLLVPIGDDCAFVDTGHGIELFTTDTMVEGVHFELLYGGGPGYQAHFIQSQ
jgi:thiamine monophosphate kinase